MPAPDDSPSSSPADVTAVSPPPADAAVDGSASADLTAVGPPSADVTAGGPPPADQPGLYTAKLGRFGVLTLIGALSWAVPAANFGTLSQALFADMDPANK
ncbi:MAG: hypothetical protein LBH76_02915, partial [Propionibacteriaceae bacterium]|nr:hypothetical protein [Propionibacteriaceae bacterium]